MSTPSEQEFAELFVLLADARLTNELALGALTLVVLEHIKGFPDEVELVWKTRRSLFNFLYLFIRYFTLLVIGINISFMMKTEWSDHTCRAFIFEELILTTIIVWLSELVLVIRVWILYQRSRTLLYFLAALLVADLIAYLTVGIYTVKPIKEYVHVGPLLRGCYSLYVPRFFAFYAIPPLVMAISMFLLTAYKCGSTVIVLGFRRAPIITVFMRDGLFWFLALVAIGVIDLVIWNRGRPSLAEIIVLPATAATAIISTRVILNLKQMTAEASNTTAQRYRDSTMGTELEVRKPTRVARVDWEAIEE
ncbi:hypothetical protein R3P38DRAFT_976366 [Favolaschia claudopus]|uniref:DUF6533 domain-containing protein n=1 Tax=Favolaschia claudopus TaxID=2862362 RepID=A0AAW0E841_9AGAR